MGLAKSNHDFHNNKLVPNLAIFKAQETEKAEYNFTVN